MSREERKKFEGLHSPYNKYWIPCVWFSNLAAAARCEGRIKDDHTLKLLLEVRAHAHTHAHTHTHTMFCRTTCEGLVGFKIQLVQQRQ